MQKTLKFLIRAKEKPDFAEKIKENFRIRIEKFRKKIREKIDVFRERDRITNRLINNDLENVKYYHKRFWEI